MLRIFRGLLFVALVIFTINAPGLHAQTLPAADLQAMRSALAAAQSGDWSRSYAEAGAISDPLPLKMLRWMDCARTGAAGRFPEIAEFSEKNPDWPGQKALRKHAEEALAGESDTVAAEWLKRFPPVSTAGKIREAEILLNSGDLAGGTEALRATWRPKEFHRSLFRLHPARRPYQAGRSPVVGRTDGSGAPHVAAGLVGLPRAR